MRHLTYILLCSSLAFAADAPRCPDTSRLVLSKGQYSSRPGVVFELDNYDAMMRPTSNKAPACFTKMNDIAHGRVVVGSKSLSELFNQKMQQGDQQSVSDLQLKMGNGRVTMEGKEHKLIPIKFSIEGPVDVVDGRQLRFHADKIKAEGIPVKGLLDAVGKQLSSLINPSEDLGVTVKDNDIFFDPEKLAHVRGHISRAVVTQNALVIDFGPAVPAKRTAEVRPRDGHSATKALGTATPQPPHLK